MQSRIFSIIPPVFSLTWSFRNHSNMLIFSSRKMSYYYHQYWEQLLNILHKLDTLAWASRGLMVIERLRVRVSVRQGLSGGGVNVQRSFHLQYHDWGNLEQGTEPPTAPRAPQHNWLPTAPGVCSLLCVCALGWVNAEHEFRVWVTILGCTFTFSLFIIFRILWWRELSKEQNLFEIYIFF